MASRVVPEGGWSNLKQRAPREHKQSHLEFIRQLPCVCCMTSGITKYACDAAHLRAGSLLHGKPPGALQMKPDDRWSLPTCRRHHEQQHTMGSEKNFWSMYRIDPFLLALVLWSQTGNEHAAIEAIRLHAGGGAG
jgi:hypothetical protein